MKCFSSVLVFMLLFFFSLNAQVNDNSTINLMKNNKGKVYVLFGWNWARYSKSDIHFNGENHDFTLKAVKAQDRPSPFSANLYLNPKNLSIPQTNLKVGYFFHHNWNVTFGLDHMKYVVDQFQDVEISGSINEGSVYDGVYENDNINLEKDFLQFEHTDGLNYIHLEINRVDRFLQTRFVDFNITEGFSFAGMVPRSDIILLDKEERDKYRLTGYGMGVKVGVNICFFNYFYIQSEAKGGFIHMPNIKTNPNDKDGAKQSFFYFQNNILLGAVFPIMKKEKRLSIIKQL